MTADVPIDFLPGMFDDHPERDDDLRSVAALLELITEQLAHGDEGELYPVWNGDEGQPRNGTIELASGRLVAEQFFLNERFFYRMTR